MAKKRASIPAWSEIKKSMPSAEEATSYIDFLLKGSDETDPEYEVVDARGPAMRQTSSSNPKRPRTLKAGYDYRTNTMTVVFRDGTWWDYNNVPEETWYAFVMAPSKGKFLKEAGLDWWQDMGPSNIERMPVSRRQRLNALPSTLDEYLFGG